jgi:hypothetical protein
VVAAVEAISNALCRRGYLTTEWWTTIVGAALTVALTYVGMPGPAVAKVVVVAAPVVVAAVYAVARTIHKSALAGLLAHILWRNSPDDPPEEPSASS